MTIVVFLDLDDTIFQTRHKCPTGETLEVAALDRSGQPSSFMTSVQQHTFDWLKSNAIVIPTTARNSDAYRRVCLTFQHAAILDFGAFILDCNGTPNSKWEAIIRPKLELIQDTLRSLERLAHHFREECGMHCRIQLVTDFGLGIYLVAKDPSGVGSRLQPLYQHWKEISQAGQFFVHWNDNNVSLVPSFLGKEYAVDFVCREYFMEQSIVKIGIGDSLTDFPFLSRCDFIMMPSHCQVVQRMLRENENV